MSRLCSRAQHNNNQLFVITLGQHGLCPQINAFHSCCLQKIMHYPYMSSITHVKEVLSVGILLSSDTLSECSRLRTIKGRGNGITY